jgi:hypothetical protein
VEHACCCLGAGREGVVEEVQERHSAEVSVDDAGGRAGSWQGRGEIQDESGASSGREVG